VSRILLSSESEVTDMTQIHQHAGTVSAISRRVREREMLRQLRYNHARKAAIHGRSAVRNYLAARTPALAREFLGTLLGALVGFLVIAELLAHVAGVSQIYTFSAFGLVYSLQSTYYKFKLVADPGFKIPSCRCARRGTDGTEGVLMSRYSATLAIPNSVYAAVFFVAVPVLATVAGSRAALPLAIVAIAASSYLSYIMLARIRSLCATCVSIAALSALVLWQLLGGL
jgi:uncharacterized membrane protein